jgi:hypothetical protein
MLESETLMRLIVPFIPDTTRLEGYGPAIPLLPEAGTVIVVGFE